MLQDIFNTHLTYAKMLRVPHEEYNLDDAIRNYCKAKDEDDEFYSSIYFSVIILKLWYRITDIYNKCSHIIEDVDAYERVVSCILTACEERKWEENKKLKPQQCVQQIITSRGAPAIFYESNLDKNKANVNVYSLDVPAYADSESEATTKLDLLSDSRDNADVIADPRGLVQYFLDENKIIEGIITDIIFYKDCSDTIKKEVEIKVPAKNSEIDTRASDYAYDWKDRAQVEAAKNNPIKYETKKKVVTDVIFASNKCVKGLKTLEDKYLDIFYNRYSVDRDRLEHCINEIKTSTTAKLKSYIKKYLKTCQQEVNYEDFATTF